MNLFSIAPGLNVNHGDCDMKPAVCAIVKCARMGENGENDKYSNIFISCFTKVGGTANGRVTHLKFYPADVKTFERPIAVVSDIEGLNDGYFILRDRSH